jgi:glycosyltransferase involved in cell wall biosynthesis
MLINKHSIILTVHNKGYLLLQVLNGIKFNTVGNYELIVVLDGCSDNSKEVITFFKNDNPNIDIIITETPDVFETKANNAGLKLATGEIVIIIQDDIVVTEMAWNDRLTKPFRVFDDVFAVTANCAHNWEINPNSKHIHTTENDGLEWSDILNHVDHANRTNISRDTFAVRQCVNRGPLAINHSDLKTLNYFDEQFEPQDMDDHDLCFRMAEQLNKVVGCYWVNFDSDINWGGTRVNGQTASWLLNANQKNTRIVFERHNNKIKNKIIENRVC